MPDATCQQQGDWVVDVQAMIPMQAANRIHGWRDN